MTPEPTSRPVRRNRPDREFRRRALVHPADELWGPVASSRESLRDALARIPDHDPTDDGERHDGSAGTTPGTVSESDRPAPPASAARRGDDAGAAAGAAGDDPGVDPGVDPPDRAPGDGAGDPATGEDHRAGPGSRRALRSSGPGGPGGPTPPTWRRVAFAATVAVLAALIPVLGLTGYRLVADSTDGRLGEVNAAPDEPGYEELVVATPTALVVQTDAEGNLVSLTVLSLHSNGGGAVLFVPVDLAVTEPAYGVDRLRAVHAMRADNPVRNREGMRAEVAKILNVGIDVVIGLDDRGWAQATAAAGPVTVDNPDPLVVGDRELPFGPVELGPDQFGPYLAALREGEQQTSQLARQELAWRGWLEAEARRSDVAEGGAGGSTIARFARGLAAGPVVHATVPGSYDETGLYVPDEGALDLLMIDAVPVPESPEPGARLRFRFLNGVVPGPPPPEVVRMAVAFNGTVVVVGNASSFDRQQTDVIYSEPAMEDQAAFLLAATGATGEAVLDPQALDTVDLTVVLGRDLLGDGSGLATFSTSTDPTPGEP